MFRFLVFVLAVAVSVCPYDLYAQEAVEFSSERHLANRCFQGGGLYLIHEVVDIDYNGSLDLVCGFQICDNQHRTDILFQYQDGPNERELFSNYSFFDLIIEDVNGDGLLDFVYSGRIQNEIAIAINNGDGSFANEHVLSTEPRADNLYYLDLDNDGLRDIVGVRYSSDEIFYFQNTGNGNYEEEMVYIDLGVGFDRLLFADFNHDSLPDIVTAQDDIRFYENLGDGNYEQQVLVESLQNQVRLISIFDVDLDGDLDIAYCRRSDKLQLVENVGGIEFMESTLLTGPDIIDEFEYGDVDSDGDYDIILASYRNYTAGFHYYENSDDGTYTAKNVFNFSDPSLHMGYGTMLSLVDWNGDGYVDVVAGQQVQGCCTASSVWYENITGNSPSTVGLSDNELGTSRVSLFPNPTSGILKIDCGLLGDWRIEIRSTTGQVLFLQNEIDNSLEIDISHFESGLYFASIEGENQVERVLKFIVQH